MTIKKTQKLKQLQSRKARLEIDVAETAKDLKSLRKKHQKAEQQLGSINKEIAQLQDSEIIISEHAILRYLERSKGFDIETIKNEILNDTTKLAIQNMGSGKYPIGNGLKACVKNNTVVSIV